MWHTQWESNNAYGVHGGHKIQVWLVLEISLPLKNPEVKSLIIMESPRLEKNLQDHLIEVCLWKSSYTCTTSVFRYMKGIFWCFLSYLRDKNLKFTCGRFRIFLDCICTLQYKNTAELKYWKLLLLYCYLEKNERHAVKWGCPITHYLNHLLSLNSAQSPCAPSQDAETNHSGLAVGNWEKRPFLSHLTNTCQLQWTCVFFPSTSVCFHLYGNVADSHFNTLSSLDEQTALTNRDPLWISCNMLSTEKQKLNLKAAGEPLTTHSCSK